MLEIKNSGDEDYVDENHLDFEIGGERLSVFFESVLGMKVGDEKTVEIKYSLENKTNSWFQLISITGKKCFLKFLFSHHRR